MKKNYITLLAFMGSLSLLAQTNNQNVVVEASYPQLPTDTYSPNSNPANASKPYDFNQIDRSNLRRSNSVIKIGVTKYDLQTNGSVARRVILHSDGTVSMVWTSAAEDNFTDRGTGYKYITTTNGQWFNATPLVNTRVEAVRTGWPCIGVLANGNEFTLGHLAEQGGWARTENSGKGTAFTQTHASVNDDGIHKPIWGRMANVGDNVYLVSSYTDSSAAGDVKFPTRKGVVAPMTYSKSTDGGKTWSISHILLPEYDSTRYLSGGGDQYSIDARDSIVVIATTDILEDLAIWKSTDYGTTFTKTIVDSFKYAPYTSKTLMIDTPFTHDGTTSVVIDKNGFVHLAWGLSRAFDDDTTNETYSFFPGTAAIGYWNEQTNNSQIIAEGIDLDINGSGTYQFSSANVSNLSAGALPSGLNHVARTGNTSVITMPSLGLDASDGVYCSFSAPTEDNLDEIWSTTLRDAYIVYSADNGTNWAKPLNASQLPTKEVAFPSITKNVNGYVHFQFQVDNIPGTNLQNNSTVAANHPIQNNEICYLALPVSQIIAASVDQGALKIENIAQSKVFVVSQNSPNPFTGSTDVIIYLSNPSSLNVTIMNVAGQVVKSFVTDELNTGNHTVQIDATNLQSGVYLYTMTASNGETVTKKMVVN